MNISLQIAHMRHSSSQKMSKKKWYNEKYRSFGFTLIAKHSGT